MYTKLSPDSRKRPENLPAIKDEKYLHGSKATPVYCQVPKMLTTAQYVNILLDPELQESKICTQVPCSVSSNSVFIVDLNHLESPKDICCDDMGVWVWVGSYQRWCTIDENDEVNILGKQLESPPRVPCYRIKKIYYKNKGSPDVKKVIVYLEGEGGLVLSIFSWDSLVALRPTESLKCLTPVCKV